MRVRYRQEAIWDRYWKSMVGKVCYREIGSSQFAKKAYQCIKSFINSQTDKLILEAGCGTGRFCLLFAKDFPHAEVIGIDISDNSLNIAESAKKEIGVENVKFEKQDLFSMNYPDNSFDVVFNEGVIEHFGLDGHATYKDAVREMIRVTRRGGKVIVAVPNWYCFPHTFYKCLLRYLNKEYEYGYEKSFKHEELIKLYNEFGLREIEISAFYPAHGFYRLSKYSKLFTLLGKAVDLSQFKSFIHKFGIEILIKGIKQ